ncbi:MAG TPA: cytochrome C oxidase subunit IV family protein [Candidatus Binatia bacterium]|nr:cytochrome C oxidase subunit IV family protein [Candidatus Binatia bacterium]
MTVHSAEEIARDHRRYLQVFAWLAVLTALEIGAVYLTHVGIPRFAIGLILVILAATKAAMVALFYMHLAVEKRTLAYIALTPAVLCVLLVFALLPDLGAFTRALTHTQPPPPAAAHH